MTSYSSDVVRRQMLSADVPGDFVRAWNEGEPDVSFVDEIMQTAAEFVALLITLATLPLRLALSMAGA